MSASAVNLGCGGVFDVTVQRKEGDWGVEPLRMLLTNDARAFL